MNQAASTTCELDSSERVEDAPLREFGVAMLSQQCWCWGQDIQRPEGNWLVQIGFDRKEPPKKWKECSSIYTLAPSPERTLVLRGFGVFYGRDGVGGVYLPRFEFAPRYTQDAILRCPPWTDTQLDRLRPPLESERASCITLMLELLDWIRTYEVAVVVKLGLAYRRRTLNRWRNGKRVVIPAESFASSWRRLSQRVAAETSSLEVGHFDRP